MDDLHEIMEAIFTAIPKSGKLCFANEHDLYRFCIENEGIEQTISIKASAKTAEKIKMYSFLFGPLVKCAVEAYTHAGWEGMDEVKTMYRLKAEFAKGYMRNPHTKKYEPYLLELSKMSKARLLKFIQDVIFFLEDNFQQEAPDSASWKLYKLTGKKMKSSKTIKP